MSDKIQLSTDWQGDKEGFSVQRVIGMVLSYWPWFLICTLVSMMVAYLYLRYTTPQYRVTAAILVQDEKQASMSGGEVLESLGFKQQSNVDNEMEIMKSPTLLSQVVRDLQLNVQVFTTGKFKNLELYTTRPFKFILCPLFEDSLGRGWDQYTIKNKGERFELTANNKKWIRKWGDTLILPIGRVSIDRENGIDWAADEDFTVRVHGYEAIAGVYRGSLMVSVPNKNLSIISIGLNEVIPERGEVILNHLMKVYMQANVDDKNKIADSTMSFIDERLNIVFKELSGIEKDIEQFKSANDMTDLSSQASMLMTSTQGYQNQITEIEVQLSVLGSLEKYIFDNANSKRIVPQSLTAGTEAFSGILAQYNALQTERERALMSMSENNPVVQNLDKQLENLRSDLKNSLIASKRDMTIRLNEYRSRAGSVTAQIKTVPRKERVFIDFSRQQTLKQELYLFLLKKREETAITKAATLANARVIDKGKSDGAPWSPKRSKVYMMAFIVGILVPGAIVYLRELLNNRIFTRADITDRTQTPIIAEIGHSAEALGESVVVHSSSRTIIAEQFRTLRTNLQFLLTSKEKKVILLTSSMSGEGKSFIALNLASTLALSNKRVLVMELDLRKPKISKMLGLDNGLGFSNHMIGQVDLNKIIVPSGVNENLYVIPSGPIPPNPSELLMMPQVNKLFATLKEHFDYIVLDTAPLGLVTDAQLLSVHADASLYVIRQGYTFKQQIMFLDELYKDRKISHLSIVVNDVKASRGAGYGYGYGYGYSYGYQGYGYGYGKKNGGYFENGKSKKRTGFKGLIDSLRSK